MAAHRGVVVGRRADGVVERGDADVDTLVAERTEVVHVDLVPRLSVTRIHFNDEAVGWVHERRLRSLLRGT